VPSIVIVACSSGALLSVSLIIPLTIDCEWRIGRLIKNKKIDKFEIFISNNFIVNVEGS